MELKLSKLEGEEREDDEHEDVKLESCGEDGGTGEDDDGGGGGSIKFVQGAYKKRISEMTAVVVRMLEDGEDRDFGVMGGMRFLDFGLIFCFFSKLPRFKHRNRS